MVIKEAHEVEVGASWENLNKLVPPMFARVAAKNIQNSFAGHKFLTGESGPELFIPSTYKMPLKCHRPEGWRPYG